MFFRAILKDVLLFYALAFTTLVVISIIEKFDYIARFALEYGLDLRSFFTLQIASIPQIMDLMLPIATVVTFYFALLNARERRELIVMATAGAGPSRLMALAVMVAAGATLASVLISGFLKPASNYIFRREHERAVAELVTRPPRHQAFFNIPGGTVEVIPAKADDQRRFRLYQLNGDWPGSTLSATCEDGQFQSSAFSSDECLLQSYTFPPRADTIEKSPREMHCGTCDAPSDVLKVVATRIGQIERRIDLSSLLAVDQNRRIEERYMTDLLRSDGKGFLSPEQARPAVKALLVASVNIFAVFCAVVAVAFTNLRTRLYAPVLGIVTLLAGLVAAGSDALVPGALLQPAGAAILIGSIVTVLLALLFAAILRLQNALLAPATRRA